MPEVHVQFISKSLSLYGDPCVVETAFVPRVGELITTSASVHQPPALGGSTFIVESVAWELGSDGFVPHVSARQWYNGRRDEMLSDRGWLPAPEGARLIHDEDDPGFPERSP